MTDGDDLELALRSSDEAARRAMDGFRGHLVVETKPDGSPVTDVDTAVERLLVSTLSGARPADALLGEELGGAGESGRLWILDPIDGTSRFARGEPDWRVHVALQIDGELEVAVVTAPALGVQWWATRGGGAFEATWPRGGTRTSLSVSSTDRLDGSVVAVIDEASRSRLPAAVDVASLTPLPLVELVRGQIDAFLVHGHQTWDHAPWILLVEEAGGRFTDRNGGRSPAAGGGLYSNASLHDELLAALGEE